MKSLLLFYIIFITDIRLNLWKRKYFWTLFICFFSYHAKISSSNRFPLDVNREKHSIYFGSYFIFDWKKTPPEIYELNIQLRFPLSLWCMKYVSKRNFSIKTHFLCASNGKSENKLKKRWSERAWRSKGRGVENLRVKTYSSYGFKERKPH